MIDFFLVSLTSVLFVVDPLGAVPAYLVMTAGDGADKRRFTAYKASLTVVIALGLFAVAGAQILHLFGISLPAFRIAGGLILLLVALDMMRAQRATQEGPGEVAEGTQKDDVAITPLAIPMLAGPASLSAVTVLMSRAGTWQEVGLVYLAIAVTGAITCVALASAERIYGWLGRTGIHVLSRVLGLVLAAISVQFILDGLRDAGFAAGATAESASRWVENGAAQDKPSLPRISAEEFAERVTEAATEESKRLHIDEYLVDNEALSTLPADTAIEHLELPNARLSDAGAARLSELKSLKTLVLGETAIGDEGAKELAQLKNLRRLSIASSRITDEGLRGLSSLEQLESLRLGSSRITGSAFRDVAEMPKLRFLILQDARIEDDALRHLHTMKNLESLYIEGNPLEGSGIDDLKAALPGLHIHW